MKDETGKWMSPEKLIEMLQQVPPGSRIYPNQVGNLAVVDQSLTFIGQIDFFHEEFERWDEPDA